VRPEAAELRIGLEPGKQIVRHRRDRVVTTKALVEGLLLSSLIVFWVLQCASGPDSYAAHKF